MIDRRRLLSSLLGAAGATVASRAFAQGTAAQGSIDKRAVSRMTAYGFTFAGLKGGEIKLADYAGHPLMVVNTASLCGFTPQYAGLQALWSEFRDRGFTIIGVPSNDFGSQEPGGAKDIADIAIGHFGIGFPMTAKYIVKGPDAHPFYKWAAEARPRDLPQWNFHKYLIGRDGYLTDSFAEDMEPADTRIKTAVARALNGA
jgi:glutathione peroxidase